MDDVVIFDCDPLTGQGSQSVRQSVRRQAAWRTVFGLARIGGCSAPSPRREAEPNERSPRLVRCEVCSVEARDLAQDLLRRNGR